jgi:hypothetical protein
MFEHGDEDLFKLVRPWLGRADRGVRVCVCDEKLGVAKKTTTTKRRLQVAIDTTVTMAGRQVYKIYGRMGMTKSGENSAPPKRANGENLPCHLFRTPLNSQFLTYVIGNSRRS